MIRAPIVATLTSRSMPTTLAVSARAALITIGVPATAAAATMKMLPTSSEPNTLATTNEATINNPEIIGMVHRPFPHLCSLPISLILPERSSTTLARYRYGSYEGHTIPTMTRVNQRHDSHKSLTTTLPLTARRDSRRAVLTVAARAGRRRPTGREGWQTYATCAPAEVRRPRRWRMSYALSVDRQKAAGRSPRPAT